MRAESVTSSRSRGSKYGSYRVRAKTSQIDETLFASPTKQVFLLNKIILNFFNYFEGSTSKAKTRNSPSDY